jgi:hypothetical protein
MRKYLIKDLSIIKVLDNTWTIYGDAGICTALTRSTGKYMTMWREPQ